MHLAAASINAPDMSQTNDDDDDWLLSVDPLATPTLKKKRAGNGATGSGEGGGCINGSGSGKRADMGLLRRHKSSASTAAENCNNADFEDEKRYAEEARAQIERLKKCLPSEIKFGIFQKSSLWPCRVLNDVSPLSNNSLALVTNNEWHPAPAGFVVVAFIDLNFSGHWGLQLAERSSLRDYSDQAASEVAKQMKRKSKLWNPRRKKSLKGALEVAKDMFERARERENAEEEGLGGVVETVKEIAVESDDGGEDISDVNEPPYDSQRTIISAASTDFDEVKRRLPELLRAGDHVQYMHSGTLKQDIVVEVCKAVGAIHFEFAFEMRSP